MEELKLNVAVSGNELIIRQGQAPEVLPTKAPVAINLSGAIGSVFEFLSKRVPTGAFSIGNSHLIVNREKVSLELVINEGDPYLRGTVKGKLELHPAFVGFGINSNEPWSPSELGMHCKMNKAFFLDGTVNMQLVSTLLNFKANVENQIERSMSENGNRTDNFSQVVNSNLPEKFMLNIPIFKGMPAESLEVETFAKINGRDVSFILLSPNANSTLESIRDSVIDEELVKIKELCPELVIIEE